jgi:hypothetical protein
MGERQVFQSDRHRPAVARDFLTDKAGDDDLEAARRAGRTVFRHLESFCEQLIDNFCGAARHGLTLTRGIAALTLLPLRAFWWPAIAFYRKPMVDYRLVYETRLNLIRGNYADDSEEPKLRAFEFAVRFCRDHNRDLDLETAKQAVMAAIRRGVVS